MAFQHWIPIGKKPPSPSMAWWYLSHEAKEILFEERLKGRFGGTMGKAPYWNVQNQGEPKANVEALYFIQKALARWQGRAGVEINSFMRG